MKIVQAPRSTGFVYHSDVGSTRVVTLRHRERMISVARNGTDSYQISTLFLNPVNPGLSKWLYSVASLFETYRFKKLIFEYVPTCGADTVGAVGMYLDLNPRDEPATTVEVASSQPYSMQTACWQPAAFDVLGMLKRASITTPMANGFRYCDFKGLGWRDPLNTLATLYPYINGITSDGQKGCWWMNYEIELATPNLQSDVDAAYSVSANMASGEAPHRNPLRYLPVPVQNKLSAMGLEAYGGDVSGATHEGLIHLTVLPYCSLAVTFTVLTGAANTHPLVGGNFGYTSDTGLTVTASPGWWGPGLVYSTTLQKTSARFFLKNDTSRPLSMSFTMANTFETGARFESDVSWYWMLVEAIIPYISGIVPLENVEEAPPLLQEPEEEEEALVLAPPPRVRRG